MRRLNLAWLLAAILSAGCGEKPDAPGNDATSMASVAVANEKTRAAIPELPPVSIPTRVDVTYLTEPLDSDGRLDYLTAFNSQISAGVTPDNNFEAQLRRIVGPLDLDDAIADTYLQRLGIISDGASHFFDPGSWRSGLDYATLRRITTSPWRREDVPDVADWLDAHGETLNRIVEATRLARCYLPAVVAGETDEAKNSEENKTRSRSRDSDDPVQRVANSFAGGRIVSRPTLVAPLSRSYIRDSIHTHRTVFRALSLRFYLALGEGRLRDAQSDLVALHRFARLVTQGPELLYFFGSSIEQHILELDIELLQSKAMVQPVCQSHLDALRKMLPIQTRQTALNLQRLVVLDALFAAANHRQDMLRGLQLPDTKTSQRFLDAFASLDWVLMMQTVNERFDQLLQRVESDELPRAEEELRGSNMREVHEERMTMLKDALAEDDPLRCREQLQRWYVESAMSFVTPRGVLIHDWLRRTKENVVQTAYAAKLHQFQTGVYPTSIEEIETDSRESHRDPLTGSSLMLKQRGGGLLIYSVGRNLIDEQGVQGRMNSPTPNRLSEFHPDIAVELER